MVLISVTPIQYQFGIHYVYGCDNIVLFMLLRLHRSHFTSLIHSIRANVERKEIVKNPQKNEEICQKIKDELNEAIEFHTKMIE